VRVKKHGLSVGSRCGQQEAKEKKGSVAMRRGEIKDRRKSSSLKWWGENAAEEAKK
jgi:hypothetical protein